MQTYNGLARMSLELQLSVRKNGCVTVRLLHWQKNELWKSEAFYLTETGWVFKEQGAVSGQLAEVRVEKVELLVEDGEDSNGLTWRSVDFSELASDG